MSESLRRGEHAPGPIAQELARRGLVVVDRPEHREHGRPVDLVDGRPIRRAAYRARGTPRVGLTTSEYGRDYRVGYCLGVLDRGNVNFELGVDAQRREMPTQGEASNGLIGRGTLSW